MENKGNVFHVILSEGQYITNVVNLFLSLKFLEFISKVIIFFIYIIVINIFFHLYRLPCVCNLVIQLVSWRSDS